MSKIFVPTSGPKDWQALLAKPETQWQQGYSAMSVAISWENAKGLPAEIASVFGPRVELLLAIPEHKVPLPGGQRESQCDVFALVRTGDQTCALAVEAKVEEPFGPTIAEWLQQASTGKIERLNAICALLGCPVPDAVSTLRYQLFHRTAAAVVEAHRFKTDAAAMVVQSFSKQRRWLEDYVAFLRHLELPSDPERPAIHRLSDGRPLTLAWVTSALPAQNLA